MTDTCLPNTRPTPQQFAQCVFALSVANPGRDLVFAPQPVDALQVGFARMYRGDVDAIAEAVERLARPAIRIREAIAATRQGVGA